MKSTIYYYSKIRVNVHAYMYTLCTPFLQKILPQICLLSRAPCARQLVTVISNILLHVNHIDVG